MADTLSRLTRLAEASKAASSSNTSSADLVILHSDDGSESEEEFVHGEGMPADVAWPMEVN